MYTYNTGKMQPWWNKYQTGTWDLRGIGRTISKFGEPTPKIDCTGATQSCAHGGTVSTKKSTHIARFFTYGKFLQLTSCHHARTRKRQKQGTESHAHNNSTSQNQNLCAYFIHFQKVHTTQEKIQNKNKLETKKLF